jgi:hypothetical protein
MPTELINLELEEVSLVAAGDDPLAKVAIIKCRDVEKEKEPMTEEMKAKLKPYMDKGMSEDEAKKAYDADMEKETQKALEEAATLKEENERLRKAFIDEGYKITADGVEKKAPEDMIEVEGEMVAKSAIPTPVLKALEAAEVAKRDAELVTKAKETLPNFDEAVAKSFMGLDLSEEMLAALKAADALMGKMTEEVGKTDTNGDMSDPQAKLDAMVAKVMAEQNVNKFAAHAEVAKTKEGRELINKAYYKKED